MSPPSPRTLLDALQKVFGFRIIRAKLISHYSLFRSTENQVQFEQTIQLIEETEDTRKQLLEESSAHLNSDQDCACE